MATVKEIRTFRGVTRVLLDGRDALKVRGMHFQKRPLAVGDFVDVEEYINSIAALQFSDAYEAALTSLDFSARTEKELRRSLETKGYVVPVVEAVLERLRENRLLDDRRYAERTVEMNANRAIGMYALKQKLRMKGISEEDAESALEKLDEQQQSEAAKKAAEKLVRKYEKLPYREAKAKLSQALARRGFAWDAIHDALEASLESEDWED